jgi:outer membrane protein assembly factor BamB
MQTERTYGTRTGVLWAAGLALAVGCGARATDELPAGAEKYSPVQRGIAGSGQVAAANLPTAWSEADKKGIVWKTPLALPGWASPIVWEHKVVALGADAEKRTVTCLDAATGKPTWTTDVKSCAGLAAEYTINSNDRRWDTLLHAAATPATNGKRVFAMFSNGQLAALDLADGKQAWSVAAGNPAGNEYGVCNGLLVFRNTVIVVFQGGNASIAAYDADSGRELWKTARKDASWASPILIKTKAGKFLVVLPADPNVTAWDAETGKEAWSSKVFDVKPEYCIGPSPIYADGLVFVAAKGSGIFALNADNGTKVWGVSALPGDAEVAEYMSMATDGKRLFHYAGYHLTCLDAKTGKVIKQKELDQQAAYANPMLAGNNLYLATGDGTLVVNADPDGNFGATVGAGKLGDTCDATPAAIDGRLFLRSDAAIYCVGAK